MSKKIKKKQEFNFGKFVPCYNSQDRRIVKRIVGNVLPPNFENNTRTSI